MRMSSQISRRALQAAFGVLASSALLLSGCSSMQQQFSTPGPGPLPAGPSATANVKGNVHGGQQPIFNSTVKLYAASYAGYGGTPSNNPALATTTTDVNGAFQFTKNATGTSSGTGTTWVCPSTGDPIIYAVASGGNTQGTNVTTTNNSAAVLMAAIGPCSTVSTTTNVIINEVTTAASVFALAQYINPGTTAGTETIGSTSSTQGATGLENAYTSIANLAGVSTNSGAPIGNQVISNTYTGTAATVTGVTVTATPESAKLVTVANILAACINSVSAASPQCADLMANANPPLLASATTFGGPFPTAVDTLQAALYMAINPADLASTTYSGATSCQTTPSATSAVQCLFNLPAGVAPFAGGLAVAPSDWAIGVTYTATGTCSNGNALISGPNKVAIDATGNVWFVNAAVKVTGAASIVELSPVGQPMLCVGGQTTGRGLTIDPTGNVWASFNVTGAGNIQEIPAGTTTPVSWTGTGTPIAITSDSNGSIFYSTAASGASFYEFLSPGANPVPFAPTQIATAFISGTTQLGYIAPDATGRIYATSSTTGLLAIAAPLTGAIAPITGFTVAGNVVTFTATNTFTTGTKVAISGLTSAAGVKFNGQVLTVVAATGATFTATVNSIDIASTTDSGAATALSTTYTKGSGTFPVGTYGIAIDNNNYIYAGATCCGSSNTAGYRVLDKITPDASVGFTYTSSPVFTAGTNGVRAVALDGAANIWAGFEFPSVASPATYAIGEAATSGSGTTATFTSLSPPNAASFTCASGTCPTGGGFLKSDFKITLDLAVDPSGNLWVLNSGVNDTTVPTEGTSITQVVGAAVPVVTPTSVAAKMNAQATKP